jgi:hypothetical protein
LMGDLIKVSNFWDLYKSDKIFGSKSGIFDNSSKALSNAYKTTFLNTSVFLVVYMKESSVVLLNKSKINNAFLGFFFSF